MSVYATFFGIGACMMWLSLHSEGFLAPLRLSRRSSMKSKLYESLAAQAPLPIHHTAVKTRNITTAIQFYSLLGFEPITKFRAGPARAAWLRQHSATSWLELIEVPDFILDEPEGKQAKAVDLMQRQDLLGLNHFALDVTASVQKLALKDMAAWLDILNKESVIKFGKNLRVAVSPYQTMIGNGVYELAFLYDADGSLVELLNKQSELPQTIDDGWDRAVGFNFQQ